MKLFYSPYQLIKKHRLNSQDQSKPVQSGPQMGVLLKVSDGENWGVADLSVRPELGDDSIEGEIKKKGVLYLRALELAQEDLSARADKKSLLFDKFVKNNYLITDYKKSDLNQESYLNQSLKIKADRDIKNLAQVLNDLKINLRLRLDFNSCLSHEEFEFFLRSLNEKSLNKIEYIEDPTLCHDKWKTWNKIVPLAFDFQKADYNPALARYRILKPSREKLPQDINMANDFTLTSAMGHAVGLAHGLRLAQQYAKNDSGFLTLDLFEDCGFQKYFVQKQNLMNFSASALNDYGIGMSEELNKLQWVQL